MRQTRWTGSGAPAHLEVRPQAGRDREEIALRVEVPCCSRRRRPSRSSRGRRRRGAGSPRASSGAPSGGRRSRAGASSRRRTTTDARSRWSRRRRRRRRRPAAQPNWMPKMGTIQRSFTVAPASHVRVANCCEPVDGSDAPAGERAGRGVERGVQRQGRHRRISRSRASKLVWSRHGCRPARRGERGPGARQ